MMLLFCCCCWGVEQASTLPQTHSPNTHPTQRLAQGDWFTSRVSSAGLFSTAYARAAQASKAELRHLYAALCKDETPMVRRAAAHKLGGFARVVEKEYVAREMMTLFTDLIQDGGWAVWGKERVGECVLARACMKP